MTYAEQILKIAYDNNGTVTSEQVTKLGINRQHLRVLVDNAHLERSGRGVYIIPTNFDDEMFNIQIRFKRGIFSHETALFLLDLSDCLPIKYSITFPSSYNTSILNQEKVKCYRVKEELYDIGTTTKKSPGGNRVKLYNAERTLCDILKGSSRTDIQMVTEAFKRYAKLNNKDIPLLSQYAKIFRVEKKVQAYLEVLL